MAWIRNTGEPAERRPTDYMWLVVGAVGTAVVRIWAQSQSAIDLNIYRVTGSRLELSRDGGTIAVTFEQTK